ncbi:MAG: hypothetical protein M1817_000023 [Caeruleum heppii]|nr:MAG: hypothetical protein M1817_000023 [Caeruleum heppii]
MVCQSRGSKLFHLTVLTLLPLTLAVYDPNTRQLFENFDPAEADPEGNITCLGPLPDWPLPIYDEWNPNTFTLQELCAKPQYGGRAPYQHLGGWCQTRLEGATSPYVAFDHYVHAQASRALFRDRLLLYCKSRCFCNHQVVDRSVQPWFRDRALRLLKGEDVGGPQFKLDDKEPFTEHEGAGTRWLHIVRQAQMISRPYYHNRAHPRPLSVDPDNLVVCTGELPSWEMPPPANRQLFLHGESNPNQQLCSVSVFHGNPYANAGAYCHRNDDGTADVFFADEMTPRLEWTWNYRGSFRDSLALRRHCHLNCVCAITGTSGNSLTGLFQRAEDAHIIEHASQSANPATTISSGSSMATPTGPAAGTSQLVGSCESGEQNSCHSSWPSDVLGPIPTPSYRPATLVASAPTESIPATSPTDLAIIPHLPTCGASCTSNADCRVRDAPSDCRCMAIGEALAQTLGADPIFPFGAACLLFSQIPKGGMDRYVNNLPRRREVNLDALGREPKSMLGCACNATYVSTACCESEDGRIWEVESLRLGRLAE